MVPTESSSVGNDVIIWLAEPGDKYMFTIGLTERELKEVKTRSLLGANSANAHKTVWISRRDELNRSEVSQHLFYVIPGADLGIHLTVPVTKEMDWITPMAKQMEVIIYIERLSINRGKFN